MSSFNVEGFQCWLGRLGKESEIEGVVFFGSGPARDSLAGSMPTSEVEEEEVGIHGSNRQEREKTKCVFSLIIVLV